MTPDDNNQKGQPPVWRAALLGLCPRCGAQTLFAGPVRFASRCDRCGLDYDTFNVGDGPAAFLTMAIGTLVIVLAFIVEGLFYPPFWVHVVLWVPFTVAAVLAGLRVAKGALLVIEHRRRAAEGHRVPPVDNRHD